MSKSKNKFKVILILLGIIVLIIGSVLIYYYVNVSNIEKNSKKMESVVTELKETKTSYVFVDINPSFVLKLKNNLVTSVKCRNRECNLVKALLDDIYGKNIVDAVNMIYKETTNLGFDTSSGVTVRSSDNFTQNLTSYSYVYVETIEKKEEEKLLSEIKEEIQEEIKEHEEELSYNEKLLNKLKEDADYGEIYSCKFENNNVECYLNADIPVNFNNIIYQKKVTAVLNRFGIETKSGWEMNIVEEPLFWIYIDGTKFTNAGGGKIGNMEYLGQYSCSTVRFKLSDLNLMNPVDIKEHFYSNEYDMVYDPKTDNGGSSGFSCGDEWCKSKDEIYTSYCDASKQEIIPVFQRIAYFVYKVDGSERKEVSYEDYLDFDYNIGKFIKDIDMCKRDEDGFIIIESDKEYCNNFGELLYYKDYKDYKN